MNPVKYLKRYVHIPYKVWRSLFFFRDPERIIDKEPDYFLSPADGTILYQKRIQSNEKVLSVKGYDDISPDIIARKQYDQPVMILGIFMSFWDIHVNRAPTKGKCVYQMINGNNKSMLQVENSIFTGLNKDGTDYEYLRENERALNTFLSKEGIMYDVIQIADDEVNVILPFKQSGHVYEQGDRIGMIRWGSQVDVIIPLKSNDDFQFEFCCQVGQHIKAGVDKIIRIDG